MRSYFDMETIPDQRPGAFETYLDAVKPPGSLKKQETIDAWMLANAESRAAEDYKKTGLTGLYGEICSVSWALEDGDVHCITRGHNENDNEHDLLEMFWFMLEKDIKELAASPEAAEWAKLQWIGHNVIDFDLRFLKQRSIVNGIRPAYFIPADARHGGDYAFDTMKEWAGWRGYVKQDELCDVLGIGLPEWIDEDIQTIDGSKVWDLYREGEFGLIHEYNRLDVWKVREIHRRMIYA